MDGPSLSDDAASPAGDPVTNQNAGLFRRVAAASYDGLLLIALLMIAAAAWLPFTDGEAVPAGHLGFQLYLLAVVALFWVGFWANGGQTLGMRAWRLKLQTTDGDAVTLAISIKRLPLAALSWMVAGLGLLWLLVDRQGLALHDRLSGTRVVLLPKDAKRTATPDRP
jgi:uncharacterized RDD family membrane protein YckC